MCEFETLALSSEHNGVVSYDIATTKSVHADFFIRSWPWFADTTVSDVILIGGVGFLVEDFKKSASGAGRGIDFVAMVHFGDLDIEGVISEDGGSLTSEMKEEVHASGVVGGVDDGD